MKIISHRGLLDGPNKIIENSPKQIDLAIHSGFDVEIDVFVVYGKPFLGHDGPLYETSMNWLFDRKDFLWIHCKNVNALEFFHDSDFNFFWHENDMVTLTSKKFIWAYPGGQPIRNSIAVLPELHDDNLDVCMGVCTDYPERFL